MARSESTSDRNRDCRGLGDADEFVGAAVIEREVAGGEWRVSEEKRREIPSDRSRNSPKTLVAVARNDTFI